MIRTYVENNILIAVIDRNLDNDISDIVDLIDLQHAFLNGKEKVLLFQFTDCDFINAAVAVIIGTIPEYAFKHDKNVKYWFSGKEEHPVLAFMKDVGLYEYYKRKADIRYAGENAIPFNKIENETIMEEYTDKIMELAPIKMEREAQCILSSYIYEIYQNGLFHSESEIGVFTSGYWQPERSTFVFSIYDMGVGIPNKVRQHMSDESISSEKCLKIAFVEGFSTSRNREVNRGLGLSRIENFIRLNNGNMKMFTDDICCIVNAQEPKEYRVLESAIKGTLIIISILADENHIYKVG